MLAAGPGPVTGSGWVPCSACGAPSLARRLDTIVPEASCVLGEDAAQAWPAQQKDSAEPVAIACPQCGGPLRVDGASRVVGCAYCGASVQLPDAVWQKLHPKRAVRPFFLLLTGNDSGAPASIDYHCVKEVVADASGNLYLYGDVARRTTADGYYDEQVFAVWSLDSQLRPRWKRQIPGSEDYYLAVIPGGALAVWHPEKVMVLRCEDGRDAPENVFSFMSRALEGFRESYGCVAIGSFPDGSLLLVGRMGKLIRISPSGEGIPLLPPRKGFLGRLIPAVEGVDDGRGKLAVCTKDGGLVVFRGEDRERHEAEGYGPDGSQRWKVTIEGELYLDHVRMVAGLDGRALVMSSYSRDVLWIGPGGATWIQRDDERPTIFGAVAVMPDGTLWHFGDDGAIKRLSAEGKVLWANAEAQRQDREQ